MFEVGIISQLPDMADFDDDDDEPIEIEGEPLSETIIREPADRGLSLWQRR